ncbi:hypothetical protein C5167_005064 [Papaver somniferum]|uniref:FK506-binding protein n=1 Tax=Papaver somniferum TaxID=3469 RepID=A0A4Y7JDP7_PAPSO|nr:peptidyl-prolyl cis-trans isomerase FKBP53-like [Papaver somniferum]RZC57765.1 hypothetical protein C5167_005064 [Papaver somniferum]
MAFWGVEIKAGKPFFHTYDDELGRLHISQATLGIGGTKQRSVVECTVGDKAPILLCALLPGKNETSPLDLEFEEEDKVILSVHGPRSVHLTGYYLGNSVCGHDDYNDDKSDSMDGISGEDTDSEEFNYDSDNDEYLEDDGEDLDMFPSGKSAVVIEEIEDDEKPTENGNANSKHPKKSDGADNQKQIVVKDNALESEDEDEDGFPIIPTNKSKESKSETNKTKEGKEVEDGSLQGAGTKRKNESIIQDSNAKKLSEEAKDSSVIAQESDNKSKKKRKKGKKGVAEDEEKSDKIVEDRVEDKPKEEQPNDKSVDNADQDDGQVKKKKNKKKNKAQESDASASKEVAEKKAPTVVTEAKKEKKRSQVRTFDNGMVIEELEMGKADAKKADNGSKVSMRYIGKLKSNGKIFDSNVRGPPFQFRLGVGQVIKGWDVGVKGMRVGDKRRLTLPPSMGYGAKGALPQIPQNAWLVFDVELVDVRK